MKNKKGIIICMIMISILLLGGCGTKISHKSPERFLLVTFDKIPAFDINSKRIIWFQTIIFLDFNHNLSKITYLCTQLFANIRKNLYLCKESRQ
jgi:uncharacterized protein YceK